MFIALSVALYLVFSVQIIVHCFAWGFYVHCFTWDFYVQCFNMFIVLPVAYMFSIFSIQIRLQHHDGSHSSLCSHRYHGAAIALLLCLHLAQQAGQQGQI